MQKTIEVLQSRQKMLAKYMLNFLLKNQKPEQSLQNQKFSSKLEQAELRDLLANIILEHLSINIEEEHKIHSTDFYSTGCCETYYYLYSRRLHGFLRRFSSLYVNNENTFGYSYSPLASQCSPQIEPSKKPTSKAPKVF